MKDEVSITVIATGFEGVSSVAADRTSANLFSGNSALKGGTMSRGAIGGVNRTAAQKPAGTADAAEIPWFLRDKK